MRGETHTRSKHWPRFEASWRARSRRRSYSASASPLWSWLKAGKVSMTHILESAQNPGRTPRAQVGHCVRHGVDWGLGGRGRRSARAQSLSGEGPEKSNQIPIGSMSPRSANHGSVIAIGCYDWEIAYLGTLFCCWCSQAMVLRGERPVGSLGNAGMKLELEELKQSREMQKERRERAGDLSIYLSNQARRVCYGMLRQMLTLFPVCAKYDSGVFRSRSSRDQIYDRIGVRHWPCRNLSIPRGLGVIRIDSTRRYG